MPCNVDYFPNRVAAGDVDQSSVVLWARAASAGTVRFEYGRDPDFSGPPDGAQNVVVADLMVGETLTTPAKVAFSGLLPGTQYYYRACRGHECRDSASSGCEARGSFRTPFTGGHNGLRFGVSSCADGSLRPFVSIRNVPEQDLDFFVALGDTVYADQMDAPGFAITLDVFRQKNEMGYSKDVSPDDNYFAHARASTAFYVDIDDHEVANDFAGGARPASQSENDKCAVDGVCFCPEGNPDGNCDRAFINETDLYNDGLQAWSEYNPVRDERYGQTNDPRTANKRKLYRHRTFGNDAALFLLDERSFRDEPINIFDQPYVSLPSIAYDKGRAMLGSKQLNDLLDDLQDAQANGITWKFVLVPEPIQNLGNIAAADRFEGYAYERAVILDYIESFCIANVVFISGDIHGTIANNLAYKLLDNEYYSAAWDISTGPVAYEEPYGPKIATNLGALADYEALDPDDQNALIEALMIPILELNRYPQIGLWIEPPYAPVFLHPENAFTPATLLSGRYSSTNTFGWTEFEIDAATQELTVTTWGVTWNSATSPHGSVPTRVSEFVVTPAVQAEDGGECLIDKDCSSCRCSYLDGIGEPGLGQCIARLPNGSHCIEDGQCTSDRCSLGTCKAKAPNGGDCLNDKDCLLGNCSVLLCRPTPNGSTCGDDGTSSCVCTSDDQCDSDRCSLGQCEAKLPNGSACLNDDDCESDTCSGFECAAEDNRPNGAGCTLDKQCESGRCSGLECQAKEPLGGDCLNDADCESDTCSVFQCVTEDDRPNGLRCSLDNQCASGRCSGFQCKAREPNGGDCLNNNDCVNDDCSGGYCRPSPNGQPCALDSSCESGRCSGLECKAKEPNGGGCLNDNDCVNDDCSGGYCRPSPNGQPCASDSSCESGRCSGLECKAKEPNGGDCLNNNDCVNGDCSVGYCRPSPNGQSCVVDSHCGSGRCSLGICEAKVGNGGGCLNNNDCVNNYCALGLCRPSANGTVCGLDSHCESGKCSFDFCTGSQPARSDCFSDGECCSGSCSFATGD